MSAPPQVSKNSVVVLFKGGRLPSWGRLTREEQVVYSQQHVDLMLSVAREHRMMRLEGFKLMAPEAGWVRFWVIEFPTLAGAEAWIDAEMAPPYGHYGYYEYYLARRWQEEYLSDWVTRPSAPIATTSTPAPVGCGPTMTAVKPAISPTTSFSNWETWIKDSRKPIWW